ncbi:MAG: alanyl-tRNA editing protein AlaXM [Chloroflexota bacterium]|nr:alanyl-tRNA editing protein AlaXM [Chloroflexota bacterium]
MTELLYQRDSYRREMDATVTEVNEKGVVLDRTAFYPGGGGQPADRGVLRDEEGNEYRVTGLTRVSGKLVHLLEGDARPEVGSKVHGEIDWERRYELMRTHTAMHILCGVVWRDYGASVTGGQMEPGSGRMDFEFERMQKELVEEIEEKINEEVEAGRNVRVQILPREEAFQIPDLIRTKINLLPEQIKEVRTVELVGLDLQADGGTHVASTSEVGRIRVTGYKSKGKINKRIYVELAESGARGAGRGEREAERL